jgi:myb proto-oncogene protein
MTLFFSVVAEVSSLEWEFIKMTEQEEDLIYRMYRLVGDR